MKLDIPFPTGKTCIVLSLDRRPEQTSNLSQSIIGSGALICKFRGSLKSGDCQFQRNFKVSNMDVYDSLIL
jgi:hypothetical protein